MTRAQFKRGDRITATQYGEKKTGTVTRIGERSKGAIVFVLFDGAKCERWMHAENLQRAEGKD